MENIKNEIILGNYGGIRVNASIDEKLEDVKLMIKYSDHGDDFLIVKTEDGIYEYGWYLNRRPYPDYDELIKQQYYKDWFIRMPELYYAFDKNCRLSNEIFWEIHSHKGFWGYNTKRFVGDFYEPFKEESETYAQIKFDRFIEFMDEVSERGITYNKSEEKKHLKNYLECNNILTEGNIKKLDAIKWSSRINGADGIAGKRTYDFDRVDGDSISFIYYKGKFRDLNKVKMKHFDDSWGFEMFDLSLKQFK